MAFTAQLEQTTKRINHMLSLLDGEAHRLQSQLMDFVREDQESCQFIGKDPSLFTSYHLVFNRKTAIHTDRQDPPNSWCALLVLGDQHTAKLALQKQQVDLHYVPGTLVFLRGKEVPHFLKDWDYKYRMAIVWFSHKVSWEEFELTIPNLSAVL
jgi:hypothetical protein